MTRKTRMSKHTARDGVGVEPNIYDQYYPLAYLRKHPALADQIIREYERDHGPLPKIRIRKNNRPHAKKKANPT